MTEAIAAPVELKQSLQPVWIDRDLSWLDFNERVLAEAMDERNPLLERVKFLAIVTSNADEFFMKRMSVLRESPDSVASTLSHQLRERVAGTLARQAQCWHEQLIPALKEQSVLICEWEELTPAQRDEANAFFDAEVFPALTPLIINTAEHFPFLSNLSTSLVFTVEDTANKQFLYARVKVPGGIRNWLALNADTKEQQPVYVRLHHVIRANLAKLYQGMSIGTAALVRLTRDAEVEAMEGETVNAAEEIRRQIKQRRFEPVVRLEFTPGADSGIRELLQNHFHLTADDIYEAPDGLDCCTLFELSGLNLPALKDKPWVPTVPPVLRENADLFEAMRTADLLVHHPYESFDATVGRFIEQAASDAHVIAIKMTVYRVGDDTPFVRSLIRAAEGGKQVACVIELKARFDEERNLHWANALQQAGAHVTFGVKGLKIHAKTALVVRKEAGGLRAYAHIGTGNYHNRTARLYSDCGLFTCEPAITKDVISLFHFLTGHSQAPTFNQLLVAPDAMRNRFLQLVAREIEAKRAGRPAHIIAKMNQLEDTAMIEALCLASEAGVPVDLIIRGFCCLRPGVAGRTENIRIRSIIGRFLEHSRIYYFANGAAELADGEVYIGSADWMERNLSKRIEVVTPIHASAPKQRLLEILEICLNDQRQAWTLDSDAHYSRVQGESGSEESTGTNEKLMSLAARA